MNRTAVDVAAQAQADAEERADHLAAIRWIALSQANDDD